VYVALPHLLPFLCLPDRDADPAEVQRRIDAGEPYTVRFKVAPGKRVEIDDLVRGKVAWDADATVGDFILLRSSGMPVYNFCVAGESR
jgi:glutamyl-tRNA synthetase